MLGVKRGRRKFRRDHFMHVDVLICLDCSNFWIQQSRSDLHFNYFFGIDDFSVYNQIKIKDSNCRSYLEPFTSSTPKWSLLSMYFVTKLLYPSLSPLVRAGRREKSGHWMVEEGGV